MDVLGPSGKRVSERGYNLEHEHEQRKVIYLRPIEIFCFWTKEITTGKIQKNDMFMPGGGRYRATQRISTYAKFLHLVKESLVAYL